MPGEIIARAKAPSGKELGLFRKLREGYTQ